MDEKLKQRISQIKTMLLEMASGNFFYRIERSADNDDIEALTVTLNMLSEELQDAIVHQGYVNRDTSILDIVQMSFILDKRGFVKMLNTQACKILSRSQEDVIGKAFENLLVEESVVKWKNTWKQFGHKTILDKCIKLTFESKEGLVIPKTGYLTKFSNLSSNNFKTLITIVHHSNYRNQLQSDLIEKVITRKYNKEKYSEESAFVLPKQKVRLSSEDIRKIREAHDILITNPENDYPPLKDFALQIGTNEFKLKYGFKELYGITVHSFLIQERLRKAQMMVQYSDYSFKSIAQMSGFKSLSHFSRSFKKRYGFSPSELRKNSI